MNLKNKISFAWQKRGLYRTKKAKTCLGPLLLSSHFLVSYSLRIRVRQMLGCLTIDYAPELGASFIQGPILILSAVLIPMCHKVILLDLLIKMCRQIINHRYRFHTIGGWATFLI